MRQVVIRMERIFTLKIIGVTALRYGKDYLAYAIRSIIDYIDQYHILYAIVPSHGHWSDLPCPDSKEELYAIARQAAGSKLVWHDGTWRMEGEQRNSIYEYAPDADVIISCDSDEIYSKELIGNIISYSGSVQYSAPYRYLRVPFIHYWRSFNKCILHDPAYPARVIFPRIDARYGENTWYINSGAVNHMGYATRPEIVAYKWTIHGHKSELRQDVNWFQDVFMANRQYDTHPVGSQYWNPETVNPLDYMPNWMQEHPFYGKEVIE